MCRKPKFVDKWNFDRQANKYDRLIKEAAEKNNWMYKDYPKILHKILEYGNIEKNKNIEVADIGMGTGNLSLLFIQNGIKTIGVELSGKMRAIARKKCKTISIPKGHFLDIPLKDRSIDLVVSSFAFHHLTELEKISAISEMKRILKPKGKIIIADLMFQNKDCKRKIKKELAKKRKQDIIDAINDEYYGLFDDLKKEFIQAGFKFKGKQLTKFVWIFCASLL